MGWGMLIVAGGGPVADDDLGKGCWAWAGPPATISPGWIDEMCGRRSTLGAGVTYPLYDVVGAAACAAALLEPPLAG